MSLTWITPAGSLGTFTERVLISSGITVEATSTLGPVTYTIIAGNLPKGFRLSGNTIKGSPAEVRKSTTSRFVVRATDGTSIEDRTFGLTIDGADAPEWVTPGEYLQVGAGEAYFILDNSVVEFQLSATDTDLTAGDTLEYFLMPGGGQLPPGLSLSPTGFISGYTDPIFAIDNNASLDGGFDTGAFDTTPIDFVEAKSNGYDSFFYDNVTFDYNEPSKTPRRLSRIYSFAVGVGDGITVVSRLFKIYVVTEEFLQADNSIVQVGTNVFTADASADRVPIWITPANLGRYRANNYLTIFLDVYDPPTLAGTIIYFLLANNPDTTPSEVPPGLALDGLTGELAGRVPYQAKISKSYQFTMMAVNFPTTLTNLSYTLQGDWNASISYSVNDAVRYLGLVYVCIVSHRNRLPTDTDYWYQGVSTAAKTFTVEIIGEIESAINWITPSDLGTIKPNQPSQLSVEAESLLYGGRVTYEFVSGELPPGLEFLSTGKIQGKVRQFADADGIGLTRLYDVEGGEPTFNITFDGGTTTFDKEFTFTVRARDSVNLSAVNRTFSFTVVSDVELTYSNIFLKAFQSKEKRLAWSTFITDATIFKPSEIYRYGDVNFGIQTELKMLVYAGIESTQAVKYVQAMSRNHYRKQILFGDLKVSKAKDPVTQETIYEVIYVEIVDDLEKNNISISNTVELADTIESKVLISYDSIKIDSDIPLVSDSDHQRVFPNSIKNMRRRLAAVGERDRTFLPQWMRSIQDTSSYETGFVKALVLCYAAPGASANIVARIKASGFDFKSINFTADRYLIDIIDGEIEDKYLAFPQRGEKLP